MKKSVGVFLAACISVSILFFVACEKPGDGNSSSSKAAGPAPRFVTTEHLFAVECQGSEKAWVTGFEGTVFHTGDGGVSWVKQKIPVKTDYYDVFFANDQTGWIVGKFGVIFKTTDSGKNWKEQSSGTEMRLFDVQFINEQTGWVVGTMGTILHTADGGKTWIKQGWDEDRYYNGVFFVDEKNGWIVGEYSTLYHTTNGGLKWEPQTCAEIEPEEPEDDFPPPPPNLYGVYFQTPDVGWVTGMDGIIIKTEDAGTTWKRLTPKTDFSLYHVTVSGKKGWAIGSKGSCMFSSDGGNTWNLLENKLKTKFWLRDLDFTDPQHGWIVGAMGTIMKTVDGGDQWKGISGIFLK